MTVSLFMRIQVEDFEKWLNPDPKVVEEMMKGQGVQQYSLNRNLEDPNALLVHLHFADENSAKSFIEFYKKAAAEWHASLGVVQEIQESWIGQVIETHSATLA